MRAVNWLYLNAILPLALPASYRGMALELRRLEELEQKSLAENRERQWESLQRLLQHAYETTPFYRQRFDAAGVTPRSVSSPSELRKIPPLTREDLRLHQEELWSRKYQRESMPTAATGGTTDTPVPLLRSPESLFAKTAMQLRFNTWAGMWPGDKVLYLWGAAMDFPKNPSWKWRAHDRYLLRRVWAPTSVFNERVLESYRLSLNRFRPRMIYCYPTPMALFAEYLRDCGRPFHRPEGIISTAEPLLPQQREVIEATMGCRVHELYGSREFGMIAAECECHEGLHVNPYAAYVELLPVEGAEVEGLQELFVTDLLNNGMPMIRYKVNDCTLSGPEACRCGRGYPLIQTITGRTGDNFILPNGDVVPGVALTNRVIKVCPGLKKTQFIQETMTEFRVRYVPGDGFSPTDINSLQSTLEQFFGRSTVWTFEKVAEIEREKSGKTRFCISRVPRAAARQHVESHVESR